MSTLKYLVGTVFQWNREVQDNEHFNILLYSLEYHIMHFLFILSLFLISFIHQPLKNLKKAPLNMLNGWAKFDYDGLIIPQHSSCYLDIGT